MRLKRTRKFGEPSLRTPWLHRYGHAQGALRGVEPPVLVVKDGRRDWGTNALTLPPREVNAHYSHRQQIEETFRLLKQEFGGGGMFVSKTTSPVGAFALGIVCSALDPADSLCARADDLCIPPVVICPLDSPKSFGFTGVCPGCVISEGLSDQTLASV